MERNSFLFLQRTSSMLEVIKITGDPNVPRGEYSFVAPNLIEQCRLCDEPEFYRVRAVQGSGQISGMFFFQPRWIEVEGTALFNNPDVVFLQSHDEISVHWKALEHISHYKRVQLDHILQPDYYETDN